MTDTRWPIVSFTLFTGSSGTLTKTVGLSAEGRLTKTTPVAGSGQAKRISLPFSDLSGFIERLNKNQCLVHGVTWHEGVKVVPESVNCPDAINRTKKHFSYSGSGLGMFDHDPDGVGRYFSPTELLSAIVSVFPLAANIAHLVRYSTSSWIYDSNGILKSSPTPGYHLYFVAKDASDLPRFGKVLFKRLWLSGWGHARLSEAGSMLFRGPIDQSVFSPERCDFVAGAVLNDGLTQHFPEASFVDGESIDTRMLPDLTETEEEAYHRLKDAERQRLKPEQKPKRQTYAKKVAKETGEKPEDVYRRLVEADRGEIRSSTILQVKDGGRMSIADMIKDDMRGAYIQDPTEQTDTWARLYIDGPNVAFVRSFLHGWGRMKVTFDTPVAPRYPAQIPIKAGRKAVRDAFATWTDLLPIYWCKRAEYNASAGWRT